MREGTCKSCGAVDVILDWVSGSCYICHMKAASSPECQGCDRESPMLNAEGMCETCQQDEDRAKAREASGGGAKYDSGKVPLDLLPYAALVSEAQVFGFGAQKYARWNYRQGFKASRLVAACLRHLFAWYWGENLDPESGLSHLAHARCCLGMLMQNIADGKSEDDRPGREPGK